MTVKNLCHSGVDPLYSVSFIWDNSTGWSNKKEAISELNHIENTSIRLDFEIKSQRKRSTGILSVGIECSMCDLISDVNYCFLSLVFAIQVYDENYVSSPSCIISFY